MGTTLDNGIYLPDEGERNCYEGLAENWVALDNHLGSTNIHVTINDKQAWNGHVADTTIHVTSADKQAWDGHVADSVKHVTAEDKQAWNGHVADTVKHVTAEDKAKWNAVTSKANDSDVVHKSGNETIAGVKSFSDDTYVKNINFTKEVASSSVSTTSILQLINTVTYTDETASKVAILNFRVTADGTKSFYPHENSAYSLGLSSRYWDVVYSYMYDSNGKSLGNEFSNNARTNLYLKANRDTSGQSGVYISRFRQNRPQGEMGGSDVVQVTFDVLENSVRTNRLWYLNWVNWENDAPKTVEVRSFCEKVDYKLTHINGLEPSALGMPSDRSARIDISSYITNLGYDDSNSYTVPANGYIWLHFGNINSAICYSQTPDGLTNYAQTFARYQGDGLLYTFFPVKKGDNFVVRIYTSSSAVVRNAYFFPCQGNV